MTQTQQYATSAHVPHSYFYLLHRSSSAVATSPSKRAKLANGTAANGNAKESPEEPQTGMIKLSMTGGGSVHYFQTEGSAPARGTDLIEVRHTRRACMQAGRTTSGQDI